MYLQVVLIKLLAYSKGVRVLLTSSVPSLNQNILYTFYILYLLIAVNGLQSNSIKV